MTPSRADGEKHMAYEQLVESLERADECLQRAVAQLVEMRFGVAQCGVLADAEKSLRVAMEAATPGPALRPLVQRIRGNAQRVQLLLDSAASLYYGWASATPDGPPSYSPDGQIVRDGGGGRMTIRA